MSHFTDIGNFPGIYFYVKEKDSSVAARVAYCNDNYALLLGKSSKNEAVDCTTYWSSSDELVLGESCSLFNVEETIDVVDSNGTVRPLRIIAQKAPFPLSTNSSNNDVTGVAVSFIKQYPNPDQDVQYFIKKLGLTHIDLGGYFGEGCGHTDIMIPTSALPVRFSSIRTDGTTAIAAPIEKRMYSTNYYLLPDNDVLKLHTLHQDEQWYYHTGCTLRIHMFDIRSGRLESKYSYVDIGKDVQKGHYLQYTVPHNVWFGAEVLEIGYSLCSCCLSPGWDLPDSATPSEEEKTILANIFPDQATMIDKLT